MDKLGWFKSGHSPGNGQCAERARTPDRGMAVRDSKHPSRPWSSRPFSGKRSGSPSAPLDA
jgi:hypothetical protein